VVRRTRARNDAAYAAYAAYAAGEIKGVVEMLVRLAGASGRGESELMNRLYRDISTATRHGILQPPTSLEAYGAARAASRSPTPSCTDRSRPVAGSTVGDFRRRGRPGPRTAWRCRARRSAPGGR
jgi:hypothetical protein